MNTLVLDEGFPFPLDSGKRIRSFNLLSRLAKRHRLRYLAYGPLTPECRDRFADSRMEPIVVPRSIPVKTGPAFYFRLAANLLSDKPYVVTSHYSQVYADALAKVLHEERPDVVIAEWTPYAAFFGGASNVRKIIVAHNVESDIWWRYLENERNSVRKWYIRQQAMKMERFEKHAFLQADGITAVSSADARRISSFGAQCPVETIDNGVDLDNFAPTEPPSASPARLLFSGSMDWRPNQDAAQFFVHQILPLLRERNVACQIILAGRNPSRDVLELGRFPDVSVTGTVPDVRPYIDQATICIVPLRIGGGSRLKILEAFAMKRPVVSTTVGAEGLEVTDGRHLVLADSPAEFASRIETLLKDPALSANLTAAGRKLVEERYGWDQLAMRLEQFLAQVVERR